MGNKKGHREEDQPLPVGGGMDVGLVLDQYLLESGAEESVLNMQRARRQLGIKRYGQSLHTHDGRDAVRDLKEELHDAMVYATKVKLEGEENTQFYVDIFELLILTKKIMQHLTPEMGEELLWRAQQRETAQVVDDTQTEEVSGSPSDVMLSDMVSDVDKYHDFLGDTSNLLALSAVGRRDLAGVIDRLQRKAEKFNKLLCKLLALIDFSLRHNLDLNGVTKVTAGRVLVGNRGFMTLRFYKGKRKLKEVSDYEENIMEVLDALSINRVT